MFGFQHKTRNIKRLLVVRLSAMGDVAMTVPVLRALASQHPELRVTVLTRRRMAALFEWMPANVSVKGVDLDTYKGMAGLTRLYGSLKEGHFDAMADLHDVLRTKYLRMCFAAGGTRVAVVDKGRQEKKRLLGNGLTAEALRPMPERYADVFRRLGLTVELPPKSRPDLRGESYAAVRAVAGRKQADERWVGIAPFAAHPQKVYPLRQMRQVAEELAQRGVRVFLFGAGQTEGSELASWEQPGVLSTCGKLGGLRGEMLLMAQLDLMIAMDSSNMHIASMMGTPVLSIWGATHPKAGFAGYGQEAESMMQNDLPCRPCSIYGKKPCQFGDLRCMAFAPASIAGKALDMIRKHEEH